jgi:hypothetical protein
LVGRIANPSMAAPIVYFTFVAKPHESLDLTTSNAFTF